MILAQQRRSHVAHACRCRYCTIIFKQNCTIWALFTRLLLQCNCLVCIVSDGIKLVSLCGISRFCPVGTRFPTDVLSHDKCFMPSVLKFDWLNKLTLCVLFDTDFAPFQFGDVSPALPLLIALLGCSETRPASVRSILSTCKSNAAVHSQPARHLNISFHTNRQLFTEILRPNSETSGVPGTTIISKPLPKSVTRTGGKHSSCAMQWRSQKLSTGGASVCSIPFCPFPLSCPTKSAVQSKNVMCAGFVWRL